MPPKSGANLRRLVLLLLGLCALILTARNRDKVFPAKDEGRPDRSHAVRNSSGQSFWETSRVQQPPLDWKHLCEIADEESGRNWSGWNARRARYQQGLKKFTVDELLDLLLEIPDFACSEAATLAITSTVLDAIIGKNPSIGFSLSLDRYKDNPRYGYLMSIRIREWVDKDPEAASIWLSQQDWGQPGEMRGSVLTGMCSTLVSQHLNHDMDRAEELIGSVPIAHRYEIIKYGFINCDPTFDEVRAAALVRRFLTKEEQPRMFGEIYGQTAVFGDYQKLGKVLQSISATEEETNGILFAASKARMQMGTGKEFQESLAEIRGWVGEQAPGALDRVTGEYISIEFSRDHNEEQAEARVLKYHDAGAGDDVIHAFLESGESEKTPETIELLRKHLRTQPEDGHE